MLTGIGSRQAAVFTPFITESRVVSMLLWGQNTATRVWAGALAPAVRCLYPSCSAVVRTSSCMAGEMRFSSPLPLRT